MYKDVIIFGAGRNGLKAIEKFGRENIICFSDNDSTRWNTLFHGIQIVPPNDILNYNFSKILISVRKGRNKIKNQLNSLGISEVEILPVESWGNYFSNDQLVLNTYLDKPESESETEWNQNIQNSSAIKQVYELVGEFYEFTPLFSHIEIESYNRCNGSCAFCPVNKNMDPRKERFMTQELFYKIVDELSKLNYSGRFALFSNNEPYLDERFIEWNKYARKKLPYAQMHIFTNGTLLTLQKYIETVDYLDELIIDNYHPKLELIKPVKEIYDFCKNHSDYRRKTTILLRNPNEILTSRGGTSPNRKQIIDYGKERCSLPFWQMIIRPSGECSLCCNDAIGQFTLGNVNDEDLVDIWYGERYKKVREALYKGRENWGNCAQCDTFF